jgi:hypothetical protein
MAEYSWLIENEIVYILTGQFISNDWPWSRGFFMAAEVAALGFLYMYLKERISNQSR